MSGICEWIVPNPLHSSGGIGTLGNLRELKRTKSLSTTGRWVMSIPWSLPMACHDVV